MPDLPTGTVTFLFTDIEGSTSLAQQFPAELPVLLARHHTILHQAIQAHNGHVFQITGDAFCASFHTANDALRAALDAQRALQHEAWSPAPIRVRMGLHTGSAQASAIEERAGGYVGYLTLTRVQRVMSTAYGGQVLLSNPTAELVRGELPGDVTLRDMGEHRLKGLVNLEHLWQLVALDLRKDFPPLQSLNAIPNSLPVQLTSFVGRNRELAEIKQLIGTQHLITLVGSGGTGKSRLSLQVAAELLDHFESGVWFVELAPLADPKLIPQTILSALGLSEQAGKAPLELLKEYLREKKSLIVLDNCEHLIEASAKVVNILLTAAPGLKVLASSREALGVEGELAYPVPSLSLPDPKHLPVFEQLSQYEAVRLFVDRAALVSPQFDVNQENAPAIAQICCRLDGIPLAIELAAARVKMMSVEQISRRLDDCFRLLTGGARTALPRQQTLRALMNWSYDLLSENERLLLCRLSVFAGGWTLEAAENVCAGEGIHTDDVLDLLSHLLNKSLIVVVDQLQSPEARYRLLETIRQYAREKLLESGQGEEIRDGHMDYYLQVAKHAELEFFGPKELAWLAWLENEWDNLRAAVEWSLEKCPDVGLELVNCLGYFLADHFYVSDMENWLSQLIPHSVNSARTASRAQGLVHWAWSATTAGHEDQSTAQSMIEESLSIYEELGDKNGLAHGFLQLAIISDAPETGALLLGKALGLFRETKDTPWIANTLFYLGWSLESHEYGRKLSYLEESLALERELGYISGIIEALKQLGAIELRLGHFESAHRRLDEGSSILQDHASGLGNSKTMSYDLGDLAFYEGHYELAQKYYEDALLWANLKDLPISASWAEVRLGYLCLRRGEGQKAYPFFQKALRSFQRSGNTVSVNFTLEGFIFTLEGLASLAVTQTRYESAVSLIAWADAVRKNKALHRPPVEHAAVERDLAIIRSQLDDTTFENAAKTGRTMTVERAIDYALNEV